MFHTRLRCWFGACLQVKHVLSSKAHEPGSMAASVDHAVQVLSHLPSSLASLPRLTPSLRLPPPFLTRYGRYLVYFGLVDGLYRARAWSI